MAARRKALCLNGHPRTTDNLTKNRQCRICLSEDQATRKKSDPVHFLWKSAKNRASSAGLPFDIEHSDITIPTLCPVLGISLEVMRGKRDDASPSLDRKDNTKGYVKGNICVISWRANRIKSNGALQEHKKITEWMGDNVETT